MTHATRRRVLRLLVSYDGTDFAGFQSQAGSRPTVQDTLERAWHTVTGESTRFLASGRTDAGVHAIEHVVGVRSHTSLTPDVLLRALNTNLPPDLAVLDIAEVPPEFHPIRDAISKRYRYLLYDAPRHHVFWRRYAWHVRRPLDVEAMHRAAQLWLGTHDFLSLQASGSPRISTIRTVLEASVRRLAPGESPPGIEALPAMTANHLIAFEIEADGFLYNMVRVMTGTLVAIGRGQQPVSWAAEVLERRDRRRAGVTAPPQGLFLVRVTMRPRPWNPEKNASGPGASG